MIRTKIWETPLSWRVKCSLPVAVRVSKTRVLKLPNVSWLKGLGHAILGNFSIDQVVIELTEITK